MLDEKTIETIKDIAFRFLNPETDKVFIFGSRAIRSARKFSDIDLGIKSNHRIDLATIGKLNEAFEESDLPYRVDIVDFSTTTEQFKNVATKKVINLN